MDALQFQDRLERLEKRNSQLRVSSLAGCGLGVAACGFAVLLLISGQAGPREGALTAESFVLVDGEGKTRASLGLSDDGSVDFHLVDIHGKTRMKLGVLSDQTARLELLDENEKTRVNLSDHFVRHFMGGEEKLDWRAHGSGLSLYSGEGDRGALPVASFGLSDGHPHVSFTGRAPSVALRDGEGRKQWDIPPPRKRDEK